MAQFWKKLAGVIANNLDWWKDYMTEMSVLVISIAVTFYGDSLIQNYQDKQEDHEAMRMVKNELEEDLAELSNMQEHCLKEIKFSNLLYQTFTEKAQIPADTIEAYHNQHRLFYYWFLKANSFDMVRESGTIQRLKKPLLAQLFKCYGQMEVVNDMDSRYREERINKILDFTIGLADGKHATSAKEQWNQIGHDETFRQYLLVSLPMMAKSVLSINLTAQEMIRETIEMIDKEYKGL